MDDIAKILVVDDERFHLNVMAGLLGDDYKVVVAKNGKRALEIANTLSQPDLILLDVLMPEMDGYEVCRQLKSNAATRHIPVIFLTVKRDVADETRGFNLGAVDYITKPFSPPIVAARVHTHLALNRALNELTQQNQCLEKRVHERTEEIIRAQEERERLQLQLQQAHKMEAIGQLTSGIAHDFNSILSTITGFADLALLDLESAQYDELPSYLEDICSASERAGELIRQLLALSRGRPGKPQHLNPVATVRETIRLIRPVFPASIKMHMELNETVPAILFDKVQMHQVIMNLCINARDATSDQGSLTVRLAYRQGMTAKCSTCGDEICGDFVELAIADTGTGVSEEPLQNIFDPLFSTKDADTGTGMGLSVIRDIVHNHHGHIAVETQLGEGTTFRLMFPALQNSSVDANPAEPAEHRNPVQQATDEKHILLVGDDVSVSMLLKELLEINGFRITLYNDSTKALEAIKAQPDKFDLLITDQNMPNMTGSVLAETALATRFHMPVILCRQGPPTEPDTTLEHELVTVFTKPLQVDELFSAIHELLSENIEHS